MDCFLVIKSSNLISRDITERYHVSSDKNSRLNGFQAGGRSAAMPATIKDITDSYRRLNMKAAFTVFLIYDVAFAMVMPM